MILGTKLRAVRLAKGHSLRDAAIHTGVSPSTLSRAERGFDNLDTPVLYKIASYCGMGIEMLVTGHDTACVPPGVHSTLLTALDVMRDECGWSTEIEAARAWLRQQREVGNG